MFSLGKTAFLWAADSASILLDLANAGRAADNGFVMAIAAGLAAVRVAALLLVTLPALGWLYRNLRRRDMRAPIIIVIVVSILFELWVSPTRLSGTDAGSADAAITEQAEGADGP